MPKQLRVGLVTETYAPQINGVARTLERLVHYLLNQGDQVVLFVPAMDAAAEGGEQLTRYAFRGFALPLYPEVKIVPLSTRRMRRLLRQEQLQLLHVATEGPLGRAALGAARSLQLPVVSSYHTNFAEYLGSYGCGAMKSLGWRYLRWFHNRTLATLCPTPSIKRLLCQQGFQRVQVWPRGVDSQFFQPRPRARAGTEKQPVFTFIYVGRLAAEKNLGMLIEAFNSLPRHPEVRLLMVGDGPLRSQLTHQADQRVSFAGYLEGQQLAQAYAQGDAFVFPSLTDTFGNVLLESMATAVPPIAFAVPGPQDVVVHGRTGWLVPRISSEALQEAMALLVSQPQLRQTLAQRGRDYAVTQQWQTINGRVRQLYQKLVDSPLTGWEQRPRAGSATMQEDPAALVPDMGWVAKTGKQLRQET